MEDFARDLMLSLPPMESREWNSTKADLTKLNVYNDSIMKERNQKMCTTGAAPKHAYDLIVKNHIESVYKDKSNVTARYVVETDNTIRTYAEHVASHNCSTGSWAGTWTISDTTLSGSIVLHAHYYEAGSNVQMRVNREFSAQLADSEAETVVQQIKLWEVELYEQLSTMFSDGEVDSSLKQVRRILPITKTRFKWDAQAQASVQLLNARAGK